MFEYSSIVELYQTHSFVLGICHTRPEKHAKCPKQNVCQTYGARWQA